MTQHDVRVVYCRLTKMQVANYYTEPRLYHEYSKLMGVSSLLLLLSPVSAAITSTVRMHCRHKFKWLGYLMQVITDCCVTQLSLHSPFVSGESMAKQLLHLFTLRDVGKALRLCDLWVCMFFRSC